MTITRRAARRYADIGEGNVGLLGYWVTVCINTTFLGLWCVGIREIISSIAVANTVVDAAVPFPTSKGEVLFTSCIFMAA